MLRKLLLAIVLIWAAPAIGAPFVISGVSDKTFLPAGVTQCGVFLDSGAKVSIPVTAVTGGNVCRFDVGTVTVGSHTVSMTAITINDPIWGSQESAQSSPLTFSRPAAPAVPTGLGLQP